MKICIIGWYGSETIGDRSILIGLCKIFQNTFGKCTIYLGSLNPFFSERCLFEDNKFYRSISPLVDIIVFNSKNKKQLKNSILESTLLVMGGGPIMDLGSLILVQYSFYFAKRNKKMTALLGRGLGPFIKDDYKRMALDILRNSDLIVFRDKVSITTAKKLASEYKKTIPSPMYYTHDPAMIPIGFFEKVKHENIFKNYILVNFRDLPAISFPTKKKIVIDNKLSEIIKKVSLHYDEVLLAPMHTFFHGHDDRLYLSKIRQIVDCEKVKVIQKPYSVLDLFYLIKNASACIGMRYHSIVFQTFINGKNAIIDYTLPVDGKIISFIKLIDGNKRFKPFYVNLHDKENDFENFISNLEDLKNISQFKYDTNIFNETINIYSQYLKKLI